MTIASVTTLDGGSEREEFELFPREEPHLHERWELVVPTRTPVVVEHRGGQLWIPTRGAGLVAPGTVHRLTAAAGDSAALARFYISIPTARIALPESWQSAAQKAPSLVPEPRDGDWVRLLRQPSSEREDGDTPPRSAVRPRHGGLNRAVRHLEQNLHRTVSLDELSEACGLSKFHLCRMFHRVVGVTPRTYHRHIRLERGRAMLLAGRGASDIARELNFSDQSHFIRSFRKQFGATPGELATAYARTKRQRTERSSCACA